MKWMKNNITIEQYDNLFLLIKKILEFYSDENNYKSPSNDSKFKNKKIIIDNGSQARFALTKINELIKFNDELDNDSFNLYDTNKLTDKNVKEIFDKLNNLTF